MPAFLQYPDLNIEIICHDTYTRVRDLSTGEERAMTISTAGFDRPNTSEKEVGKESHTRGET